MTPHLRVVRFGHTLAKFLVSGMLRMQFLPVPPWPARQEPEDRAQPAVVCALWLRVPYAGTIGPSGIADERGLRRARRPRRRPGAAVWRASTPASRRDCAADAGDVRRPCA